MKSRSELFFWEVEIYLFIYLSTIYLKFHVVYNFLKIIIIRHDHAR